MLYIKRHFSEIRFVLAVADSELVGKRFEDSGRVLNISVYFFKGELADEKKAAAEMKGADYLNIIGEEAIRIAVENGFVEKGNVFYICDIPYAMVFNL